MRACPDCGRLYSNDSAFCHADGAALARVSQVPPPRSGDDPRVGSVLGDRYLLFRVVADGAMGRVYEGFDRQVERHVALKILHPDVARDGVSVERFKREWEVSRMLPHRHVIEVTDFFQTEDGSYVLVMEFLVGEELRATLSRLKVVPPARIVRLVSQLALALDVAHRQNLVHRDLKPENIFLCQGPEGDSAKVLDFGSVKARGPKMKQLTVMGTTIGSPFYMSPEQAQALDSLDHRTDVWALAAVCYEALTGSVPFSGPNGPSILVQILSKQPRPPSELALGTHQPLPPQVDRALLRGLTKSMGARTSSVGELADELGAAFGLLGSHAQWAVTPETELAAAIERALPQLFATPVVLPAGEEAAMDAFFGETASLGQLPTAAESTSPGRDDADSLVLPVARTSTLTYAVAALIALVLLGGIFYWVTR